ncbi:nitrogen fixation protein NifZ [Aquisphaera insulae]|uniref:nitrogen fixation protein NifZ n=1 Tax=Aquisphaera insulae TaxID=2712864 RepID=UPI0013ED3937|nr:nitrogen fixation protein NifZ [Aquisphaera insulae]
MMPRFDYGELVRVVRTVRNDGTFPGKETGDVLAKAGSVGFVRNVGTFLQDQIIYSVHFTEVDLLVGCREEELIGADEPWVPAQFLFRDKVASRIPLAIGGVVVVAAGTRGEVLRVLRDHPGGPAYHAYFDGRTFLVPESALEPVEPECMEQPA